MKQIIFFALLVISTASAFSQNRFSNHEISLNGFRNPSIGLEYRYRKVSVHAGYYLTNFTSGTTTEFVKTGFSYWFLPLGQKEQPSSFYAGASYLRGLTREYEDQNALGVEAGFRWMIWKGLNFRIGAIGWLLIAGAIGVLIPYTILTLIFDYPDILREEAGTILTRFHTGGSSLIATWWAFAALGLPLLVAYVLIGQKWENELPMIRWVTTLGVISGIAQIIDLLRWVFVVPVLASNYVNTDSVAAREAAKVAFQVMHQFGGVLLGEHIGQLFTILWTVMMSYVLRRLQLLPIWISDLGIAASLIYLLAQAELFATVIPGFPVWSLAGLTGSTLWLLWLVLVGVQFIRLSPRLERVS